MTAKELMDLQAMADKWWSKLSNDNKAIIYKKFIGTGTSITTLNIMFCYCYYLEGKITLI